MINYSFIIPHKNSPNLLQRCVDSIPERDDVQIIVVDDNSNEGKKPSFKERKSLQVILLDAEHSKGAGHARNAGLEHAKGKWLLFADADDYYKEGFLNVLDKYKEEDLEVLYYNCEYRKGKTGESLFDLPYMEYYEKYDGSQYAVDQIKFRIKVPWTKMVRRDFVQVNKIQFEETLNGNDIFFSMTVGYLARNIMIDKTPLYVYLKNENSLVNSKKKSPESRLCKIIHCIQLNYLYKYLGYPEWRTSEIKLIFRHVKLAGFPLILLLLKNISIYFERRVAWVKIFKSF